MSPQACRIATLAAPPSAEGTELACGAEWLEVRADLVGDLDPDWLRDRFSGQLLYTLRSRAEGGRFEGSARSRRNRQIEAGKSYDRVDLEGERDLVPKLLAEIPPEKRIVSWHGPPTEASKLKARLESLSATEASLYKLVPAAKESGEELEPLRLLASVKRQDVTAFSSGAVGVWTRMVAPYLGARVVYGALGEVAGAPGQPTLRTLEEDYGLPELPEVESCFGIVGRPVSHSLSPRLHNRAYRRLGIKAAYLPFHTRNFGDFWLEVVEEDLLARLQRPLAGLSVTTPFKTAALAVAGATSPLADQVDSANTLVRREGVWEAETTDPQGVVGPVVERGLELRGRSAAVVGCGGAGRAAAAGLRHARARVTLVNRNLERGRRVAQSLGLPFVSLADFKPQDFHILVHATSLGHSRDDELPFAPASLKPEAVVVDMVYGASPTRLVEEVRGLGRIGIDGREVLLHQAVGQFRLMTGRELPQELGRQVLGLEEVA